MATPSDTVYVTELVVPGTVNTMPEATLDAFDNHGSLRRADNGDAVTGRAPEAREVLDAVAASGVDLTEIFTWNVTALSVHPLVG
ncbi:hypothetical protein ACQPWY_13990 [Pseudonocardia xinjiangensis]|uniref:hypothetical protein n=1 Tax=Pseudonocardia xinjiangensis TaxID=75289 RepID=UPI003D8FF3FC